MRKSVLMLVLMVGIVLLTSLVIKAEGDEAVGGISAEIIEPISISNVEELSFGILASPLESLNLAELNPESGSVTYDSFNEGYPTAASFEVTGTGDSGYREELPDSTTLFLMEDNDNIHVNSFTSSLENNIGSLSDGFDSFTIGATLVVNSGQTPGTYHGEFTVLATYE